MIRGSIFDAPFGNFFKITSRNSMDRNGRDDACPGRKLFWLFGLWQITPPARQPAASDAGGTCTAGCSLTWAIARGRTRERAKIEINVPKEPTMPFEEMLSDDYHAKPYVPDKKKPDDIETILNAIDLN